jgi:hypothetical protein
MLSVWRKSGCLFLREYGELVMVVLWDVFLDWDDRLLVFRCDSGRDALECSKLRALK